MGKSKPKLDPLPPVPNSEEPDLPLSPLTPTKQARWGSWLSRAASSAYDSVVGSTPESYENLEPSTKLFSDMTVSTQFGEVAHEERQALWRQLACTVGRDLMNLRLSLPIWIFEPTTTLVRMAESFEFSELLDSAAANDDPILRDSLVAAFVLSSFSGSERVRKPFNPLLGETFEFLSPMNGMRFYAEQVSHHPPLSVSYCEGKGWKSSELVDIKATFYGNAVEVVNVGYRYIELTESGDRYVWNLPRTLAANLFIGGAFLDHYGTIELRNETTGTMSRLELTKCGWFSAGRYEVTGQLLSKHGIEVGTYKGAWNKILDFDLTSGGKNRLWMAGSHLLGEDEGGGDSGPFAKCTKFTSLLLHVPDDFTDDIPINDSRLRPDRIALSQNQKAAASEAKLKLEARQRERKRTRVERGIQHQPRFFKQDQDNVIRFSPTGTYWDERRSEDILALF